MRAVLSRMGAPRLTLKRSLAETPRFVHYLFYETILRWREGIENAHGIRGFTGSALAPGKNSSAAILSSNRLKTVSYDHLVLKSNSILLPTLAIHRSGGRLLHAIVRSANDQCESRVLCITVRCLRTHERDRIGRKNSSFFGRCGAVRVSHGRACSLPVVIRPMRGTGSSSMSAPTHPAVRLPATHMTAARAGQTNAGSNLAT